MSAFRIVFTDLSSPIEEEPDATYPDSDSPDEPEEFWCGFESYSAARHYLDDADDPL